MKTVKIKRIGFLTIIALLLSACNVKDDPLVVEVFVPQCGSGEDSGKTNAVAVNGKTIKKTEEGAKVRIWHTSNGDKFACMISGEAKIIDN